ncbi:MAG: DEAD/DEAH box helicase [Desulfovibrionaceae bacterium]|nr:DEAD/DEAH box helicase [Desulfovibrionaceae bacterium]
MNEGESIALGRSGRLKLPSGGDEPWQAWWFRVSADRLATADPVVRFWQMVGAACITALCHIASNDPDDAMDLSRIQTIAFPEEAHAWVMQAPPMEGGEFLTTEMLHTLWEKLLVWCSDEAIKASGLAHFLSERAPKWQHVGRVFFHLAENKMNAEKPFAFLATYAVGLNDKGQPRHVPLSNILKRYAKEKDKQALLRLLEPLHKASQELEWVDELVEKKSIYQPLPWTPGEAYTFLKSVETLQACGLGVRLPNWWQKRSRPRVKARVKTKGSLTVDALVDVDLRVAVGEEDYDPAAIEALLAECADGLVFFKGQWIEVDKEKLEQALAFWRSVEREASDGSMTFAQGMRLLAGIPQEVGDLEGDEIVRAWSYAEPGPGFQELLEGARKDVQNLTIPGLRATLRPYQKEGVAWLSFLGRLGLGACLADDMGLGKTLQILALLLFERGGHPSLLIAPASLLSNWKAEANRFAPDLRLLLLHGKSKAFLEQFEKKGSFEGYDLVLVSYSACARNPWLARHTWKRVIADEAQAIKNAETNQSRAVRALSGGAHIALTGTPIENKLSDLWALFDFLNPGLLGSAKAFQNLVKSLEVSEEHFAPLRRLTRPYILRRMKTDRSVIDCLPDKTEVSLNCHLTTLQAAQYQSVAESLSKNLESLSGDDARAKRRVIVLQSLMLLKQICNHPDQASQSGNTYDPEASGKFMAVRDLCETIAERQEKVLIFTQFRAICDPLLRFLTPIFGSEGLVLHGGIPVAQRRKLVEAFQSPDGPPFFILTLKVGGTGLTLTEANHVIHFDRWWNPAVEDQASDRAFRIGQKKNVLVHKCITLGTLEEKIDELIADKRALADEILSDKAEVNITALSDEQILNLVRLDLSQYTL